MHDEMRAQVDHERHPVEEADVSVFFCFELFVRLFLGRLEFNLFTIPFSTQRQIMIPNDCGKARISHEQLEYLLALWTLRDQISHGKNPIVIADTHFFKQLHQLVVTTVNVSHYNPATCHYPSDPLIQREIAVYCIAQIQSMREFLSLPLLKW